MNSAPPASPSSSSLTERLAIRAKLVGRAAAVGAGIGGLAVLAFGVSGWAETVFALGALILGFGLLGWSGSVFVGNAAEATQEFLGLDSDWTEADSRRAMARIGGFGAGVMAGVALVGSVFVAFG
jgi:hypothetical protein